MKYLIGGGIFVILAVIGSFFYVQSTDWQNGRELNREFKSAQNEEVKILQELQVVDETLQRLYALHPNTVEGTTDRDTLLKEFIAKRGSLHGKLAEQRLKISTLQDKIKLREASRSK